MTRAETTTEEKSSRSYWGFVLWPLAVVVVTVSFSGCAPPAVTKKEYDKMCGEAVNLHNTITGQVFYEGTKDGYDYFLFEPFGLTSHKARVKEGEVALAKRFPYSADRKN